MWRAMALSLDGNEFIITEFNSNITHFDEFVDKFEQLGFIIGYESRELIPSCDYAEEGRLHPKPCASANSIFL